MFRRNFLKGITTATAAGATAIAAAAEPARQDTTVSFRVKGFSCVTCAIGLEVMLREQKGVTWAKASYPEGKVSVGFDRNVTSGQAIQDYINTTTGFIAEPI